jgi:hypothetical protein
LNQFLILKKQCSRRAAYDFYEAAIMFCNNFS